MRRLTLDLPVEDEAAHDALLGVHVTYAGQVAVAATSVQVGEVCTFEVTGELPSILAWLGVTWQSDEEALEELGRALAGDRLTLV